MKTPQELLEYVIAVSRKMAEIHDPSTLHDYVISEVIDLVKAEHGYLVLIDENGSLDFKAMRYSADDSSLAEIDDGISRSILNHVVQSRAPLVLGNAIMDKRFAHSKSVIRHRLRSVMCVPLMSREIAIGAIYVENRSVQGLFREADVGPLSLFSNQAAVSIENARLYHTLEDRVKVRTAELEELNWRLSSTMQQLIIAKRKADAANHAKSSFLANMSHELRTPLNGILGYTQVLQRDEQLSDAGSAGVKTIYESGQHLLTLINDVLDLAKIESGRLEIVPREMHVPSFLNGIVMLMRMSAEQKGLVFEYKPAHVIPELIKADETRLRQVLLNLLGNAIKFTESGSVTFRVAAEPLPTEPGLCGITFQISDTGPGISAGDLEEIFYPFIQAGTQFVNAKGTGLGLSITQQLVDLMGGELTVESEVGHGSRFSCFVVVPILDMSAGHVEYLADSNEGLTKQMQATVYVTDQLTLPPQKALQELVILAQEGKLSRMIERTQQLANEDAEYAPFVKKIMGYLDMLDMQLAAQFISNYIYIEE